MYKVIVKKLEAAANQIGIGKIKKKEKTEVELNDGVPPFKMRMMEDLHTDFKASLFVSQLRGFHSYAQYYYVAKSIASFINADGGTLYLGVDEHGYAEGVDRDVQFLGTKRAAVCRGPTSEDSTVEYGGTVGDYVRKIKELVKAYLGPETLKYIGDITAEVLNGRTIVKVPVKRAGVGYVAYVLKWRTGLEIFTYELYQRTTDGIKHLEQYPRDEFIRQKYSEELKLLLAAHENAASKSSKEELIAAIKEFIDR